MNLNIFMYSTYFSHKNLMVIDIPSRRLLCLCDIRFTVKSQIALD